MKLKFRNNTLSLVLLACLCAPPSANAQPQHAIAMHGEPKQGVDYKHFSYANPQAVNGGVLRLGVVGTFDSLHPFIVRGTAPATPAFSLYSSSAVYERLMARSYDEPFTLYGLIAQTVEVPENRSSITFNLNPKAHWSDGKKLTADDVLFSYETLRDKGRPNHRAYYKKVATATKLSDHRVRFDFKKDARGKWDLEMPLIMGLMPVLPKHEWQDRTFNKTTLRLPLASGPYKVAVVDVGRSLTLQRDPNYWGKDLPAQQGLYNFDEVKIDFYRDDSVALQAFKAGAYDLRMEADPQQWLRAYEGPALDDGRIKLASFPHQRTEAMRGFVLNTRRPLLQDKVLRKALNLAFDFGWINKALFQGLYKRTISFYPNSELAAGREFPIGEEASVLRLYKKQLPATLFTQSAVPAKQNGGLGEQRAQLVEAMHILKDAGYVLRNGKLMTSTGVPVSFDVMLSDPIEEKIALEWARNLDRLGITANIRTVDSAQYQARLTSFDYDVTVARWFNSLSPGNEQSYFWGCAAAKQQGSRNYPGICDPVVDALATAIPAARTRAGLVATTRALDRVLMAGYYVVPFYHLGATQIAFWQKRLAHDKKMPLYGPILESWWSQSPQ